jgi:SLT domain-containing protein
VGTAAGFVAGAGAGVAAWGVDWLFETMGKNLPGSELYTEEKIKEQQQAQEWFAEQSKKTLPGEPIIKDTSIEAAKHAFGGILTQPHLGMVAEAGPEAIIPLSVNKRNRAMDVFEQTANILGIPTPDVMMQKQGPEGAAATFDFPVTARMETMAIKPISLMPEYAPFAYPSDEVDTTKKFASLITMATIEKSNTITQELSKTVAQAKSFNIDMVNNVKDITEMTNATSMSMFAGSKELMPLVQSVAARFGLPPALLAAVIQAESGWRPNAVSPAGAIGLTQVMPGTARAMGYNVAELARNPALQIEAGARYLSQQYRRFGSWPLALAAYNAGPGAVSKYGGIPPYPETQNYVHKILSLPAKATGGIVDHPVLAGEAGPEAIIPLSANYHAKALDLWSQTGEELGIETYQEGGFAPRKPNAAIAGNTEVKIDLGGINIGPISATDLEAVEEKVHNEVSNAFRKVIASLQNRA